jgi:EEF1A N-terminal glycine/lysine methyltransferase
MLLPSLITLRFPADQEPTPEDIFSSSLGSIFTDDLQNQHGTDPRTTIIYKSRKYGNFEFRTADVNGEDQRRKYAHYLWNAGILMAELVGGRPAQDANEKAEVNETRDSGIFMRQEEHGEAYEENQRRWWVNEEEEPLWKVEGEAILELGAGAWT